MINFDYSKLTQVERDALDATARAGRPDDPTFTGAAYLRLAIEGIVERAVDAYVEQQKPELQTLAVKLLNVPPEVRADLIRQLEEAQPAAAPTQEA